MSEIVEQLRSLKGLYATPPAPFTSKDVLTLMHEAADEIERLKAALLRYGLHTWDCANNDSRGKEPCDCGWEEARAALEGK